MSTPIPSVSNEDPTQLARGREGGSDWQSEESVLQLGGFSLLAFGLFNSLRIVLTKGAGFVNETAMAKMSQFLSIYPILLLGLVLVFSIPGAIKRTGFWLGTTRLSVPLIAIIFLSFTPLAFYHRSAIVNQSVRQQSGFKVILQKRKNDILSAVNGLSSPDEFRKVLAAIPEVRNVNIPPTQTANQIRKEIISSIDRAVTREIQRVQDSERRRITSLNSITRDIVAGSLLAGSSLIILTVYLHPWIVQVARSLMPRGSSMPSDVLGATEAEATGAKPRRRSFTRRLSRYFAYLGHDVVSALPRSFRRSSRSRRRR